MPLSSNVGYEKMRFFITWISAPIFLLIQNL